MVLKVFGWEYVLNQTAFVPGWRICVVKWSFNFCFTFNLWMSLLLWSLMTLIFMFVLSFVGIFMASVTVVSQCLPGIYGFILRMFLWGRETLSPSFYRLGTEAWGGIKVAGGVCSIDSGQMLIASNFSIVLIPNPATCLWVFPCFVSFLLFFFFFFFLLPGLSFSRNNLQGAGRTCGKYD